MNGLELHFDIGGTITTFFENGVSFAYVFSIKLVASSWHTVQEAISSDTNKVLAGESGYTRDWRGRVMSLVPAQASDRSSCKPLLELDALIFSTEEIKYKEPFYQIT